MRQKGLVGIFVLVLVLVVAVAGGAYYLGRVSTKSQVNGTTQVTPTTPAPDLYREPNGSAATANWNIYSNSKYGYSIKYPRDLTVWSAKNEHSTQVDLNPSSLKEADRIYIGYEPLIAEAGLPHKSIMVSVFNMEKKLDPFAYLKETNNSFIENNESCRVKSMESLGSKRSRSSNGIMAIGLYECDLSSPGFVATNSYIAIEITQNFYRTDGTQSDVENAEVLFDQILSTFKFTPQ